MPTAAVHAMHMPWYGVVRNPISGSQELLWALMKPHPLINLCMTIHDASYDISYHIRTVTSDLCSREGQLLHHLQLLPSLKPGGQQPPQTLAPIGRVLPKQTWNRSDWG